jgi:chromosome segregation ATPase
VAGGVGVKGLTIWSARRRLEEVTAEREELARQLAGREVELRSLNQTLIKQEERARVAEQKLGGSRQLLNEVERSVANLRGYGLGHG